MHLAERPNLASRAAFAAALALLALSLGAAGDARAEEFSVPEVGIRADLPNVTVETADGEVLIERIQDQQNVLEGDFARTSRPCPPFCIQPWTPAPGVTTLGELELLERLEDPDALVIDSRTLEWYLEGTIPGAVHMPYTEIASRLDELGCVRVADDGGGWDCSDARSVALFCNGPWCGQSPTAIRAMIREGYPPERIAYYRGGMQVWRLLGLTVVEGDF